MAWIAKASKPTRSSRAANASGTSGAAGRRSVPTAAAASKAEKDCLFCRVGRTTADRRDLVLARRPHAMLMLNRYPYASAHLMVAVKRHAARFAELKPAEATDLLELVALAERALEAEY